MRWLVCALLFVACDGGEERSGRAAPATEREIDRDERTDEGAPAETSRRTSVRDEPAGEPDEAPDAPACRLEPAFATRAIAGLGEVVAIARSQDGAEAPLVVASAAAGHVVLRVEEAGLAPVEGASLSGDLIGLEPLGALGYLALALGPCSDGLSARCLSARAPTASAPAIELPQPAALRTLRVAATDGLVYLARSYQGAPPTLDRFGVRDGALVHEALRIGDGLLPEEPVEILALTADGAAYALVYRHGATEDAESGVVLATQLDEHHVEELHDALVIESMTWVGSSIAVLAAFEFARPAYFRLGPDGEVRTPPREIPFGIAPPDPFAGRLVARAHGSAGAMQIEVRSATGDRIGELVPVERARAIDLAREPGGFLVAWSDGASVFVAHLRC